MSTKSSVVIIVDGIGIKMIGSLLTRGLVLILGYAYPAYECYKTVELNKPDIQKLQFWCQYWILVAGLTVGERIGDTFIGWLPMYGEAKLAFFIYLWFPKTKGTTYVYSSFFKPYVSKHETEIDRNLLEWRTRAGDMAVMYFQKAASYGQTRIFEILQFCASQSPLTQPVKPQKQDTIVQKSGVPSITKSVAAAEVEPPSSPASASTTFSSEKQEDTAEEDGPSGDSKAAITPVITKELKTKTQSLAENSKSLTSSEEKQVMQNGLVPKESIQPVSLPKESIQSVSKEEILHEGTKAPPRITRLRRTRGGANGRLKD